MGLFKKKEEKSLVVQKDPVTPETVQDYMRTFGHGSNLEKHELEAFVKMATEFQLNPFKREIHCSAYGSGDFRTLTIVVGYEVYIQKAEQSGLLEYWHVDEASPDVPLDKYWATLVVKRRDRASEQKWTAYYTECVQFSKGGSPNRIWAKQPRMMTKKVAMSQGFRLFFEDVMHGIPYTQEEMPENKGGLKDITPESEIRSISENKPISMSKMDITELDEDKSNVAPRADTGPLRANETTFADVMKAINALSDQMAKIKYVKMAREVKDSPEGLSKLLEEINEKDGYGG